MDTKKPFWKTKRFWGAALTTVSTGLELFLPNHTVGYKVGVFLGIGLTTFGFIDKGADYKYSDKIKEKLPSGMAKRKKKSP